MSKYDTSFLYPSLDDANFSFEIASRKEFYDTIGTSVPAKGPIAETSAKLCYGDFELAPHQAFVRNFLSFQTPYDGLLLFHGLGSGKTCSAISVCEEMRAYMRQMDITRRIIVVASPNVQDNFRLQMFDERKLELVDGLWNLQSCTGNSFLQEINPMAMKGLTRDNVIKQIRSIINKAYLFLGYLEFANYVASHEKVDSSLPLEKQKQIIAARIKHGFQGRLIVVDEVHNIRAADDNKSKKVTSKLDLLVNNAGGMRLVLLSATPMYNSPKEISWLLNMLHVNDGRPPFLSKDLFDKSGNVLRTDETGGTVLARKAIGYVSFVRADSPYTFPFRIWPPQFDPAKALSDATYPSEQMNGRPIVQPIEILSLFTSHLGGFQEKAYAYIVENIKAKQLTRAFSELDGFGYTILQRPLEALNMTFPYRAFSEGGKVDPALLVGGKGLKRIMDYTVNESTLARSKFSYREEYATNPPFAPGEISKYSGKIASIMSSVEQSIGVVLVYSQYIDGGIVPLALALEETGFTRATPELGLLSSPPKPNGLKYVVISGDRGLSPNNSAEVALATDEQNSYGAQVKVILISMAGSEGLDFKFVRQVHVVDPWYNMNRIEQIIGRAVRWCSHRSLPMEERNVMVFLHVSLLENSSVEAADVYVYRVAEGKAIAIGRVSRVLKEHSVDCLLRSNDLAGLAGQSIVQRLSNNKEIDYVLGDVPFSAACDYMEKCDYECKPTSTLAPDQVKLDTYAESFIVANTDRLLTRIRQLFKERHFYTKDHMVAEINVNKSYPMMQIDAALERLVSDGNEFITDMYGRMGRMQNVGELYVFIPLELQGELVSLYDRRVPLDYKRRMLSFTQDKELFGMDDGQKVKSDLGAMVFSSISALVGTAYGVSPTTTDDGGRSGWFVSAGKALQTMGDAGFSPILQLQAVTAHAIEILSFGEIVALLNHLPNVEQDDLKFLGVPMLSRIYEYFNRQYIVKDESKFLLLLDKRTPVVVRQVGSGQWALAGSEATRSVAGDLKKLRDGYMPFEQKCGTILGFMGPWKEDYVVFKFKDPTLARNKGARCDQAAKSSLAKRLVEIGEARFAEDHRLGRGELCCILEILLRHMENSRRDGLKWFIPPGLAVVVLDPKQPA